MTNEGISYLFSGISGLSYFLKRWQGEVSLKGESTSKTSKGIEDTNIIKKEK